MSQNLVKDRISDIRGFQKRTKNGNSGIICQIYCQLYCQLCISLYLQFPSSVATYEVNKCDIRYQWM